MINYAEKRDFLRMPIDCALSFNEAGYSKKYQGKLINLSSKGVLFTCGEKFSTGDKLNIVITPSNPVTQPMEASAVVSRVIDNQALFEIACELDKLK